MFCGSSSQCRGLVCSMWLWYFLIILTYFFGVILQKKRFCFSFHLMKYTSYSWQRFIIWESTKKEELRDIWPSYFTFQKANNKGADQTAQMRRLVCAFVVRKQQSQSFWHQGPYDVEAQAYGPLPGYVPVLYVLMKLYNTNLTSIWWYDNSSSNKKKYWKKILYMWNY